MYLHKFNFKLKDPCYSCGDCSLYSELEGRCSMTGISTDRYRPIPQVCHSRVSDCARGDVFRVDACKRYISYDKMPPEFAKTYLAKISQEIGNDEVDVEVARLISAVSAMRQLQKDYRAHTMEKSIEANMKAAEARVDMWLRANAHKYKEQTL